MSKMQMIMYNIKAFFTNLKVVSVIMGAVLIGLLYLSCFLTSMFTEKKIDYTSKAGVTISSFLVSAVDEGIELKAETKSEAKSVKYKFSYTQDGKSEEVIVQDYKENNRCVVDRNNLPKGKYNFKLLVENENKEKTVKIEQYNVGGLTLRDVNLSLDSPQNLGQKILIDAPVDIDSKCDISKVVYTYEIKDIEGNDTKSEYTIKDNKAEWTPKKAGLYNIKISVKDNQNNTDEKEFTYEIKGEQKDNIVNKNSFILHYKGFDNPHLIYQLDNRDWSQPPGQAFENNEDVTGYPYKIVIDMEKSKKILFAINDGDKKEDTNNGHGYEAKAGEYTFSDGKLTCISNKKDNTKDSSANTDTDKNKNNNSNSANNTDSNKNNNTNNNTNKNNNSNNKNNNSNKNNSNSGYDDEKYDDISDFYKYFDELYGNDGYNNGYYNNGYYDNYYRKPPHRRRNKIILD